MNSDANIAAHLSVGAKR